ncbi:hypothetical protein AB0B27_27760, partial [Micromonospora rifamycinica]|uniref:hypothetical protein n=1 Tax=Micromonospora rifamycinica TaxID=291594 RepID=UPI0033CBC908
QMRPYLVKQLLGPDRTTSYYTAQPRELRQPVGQSPPRPEVARSADAARRAKNRFGASADR